MLIVIVISALIFFGLVGLFMLGSVGKDLKKRGKAEADPKLLLDAIFNGEPTATHTIQYSGLSYDTVMKAAPQYGYKFLTENQPRYGGPTLVFEKV